MLHAPWDPGCPNWKLRDVEVGVNAFVLYRTKAGYDALPPLADWSPRGIRGGSLARSLGVPDTGEYVIRLSDPTVIEGLPQGISLRSTRRRRTTSCPLRSLHG